LLGFAAGVFLLLPSPEPFPVFLVVTTAVCLVPQLLAPPQRARAAEQAIPSGPNRW
jgi:hypothetical protein